MTEPQPPLTVKAKVGGKWLVYDRYNFRGPARAAVHRLAHDVGRPNVVVRDGHGNAVFPTDL